MCFLFLRRGANSSEGIAGDLGISVPTARRQAPRKGIRLLRRFKVLMLHGLLHLAGFDHETDKGQMARRETAVCAGGWDCRRA